MTISVAVVDDDRHVRIAICRYLRAAGIHPVEFTSAEDFLGQAVHVSTDCIVLDVHLGGMSGFELHERLIEDGNALPTIFISASDHSQNSDRARKAGCVDFLCKPVSGDSLLGAVHRAIDST